MMNIHATVGHKVIVTEHRFKSGYPYDKEKAEKHLKVGGVYTIDHTVINKFDADVYLREVPNVSFSTIHFEDHTP